MQIRVMLAEDQNLVRQSICNLLALSDNIEVVGQVVDGSEVVDGIERYRPDVLLLDIRMPKMTGIEALHAMNENAVMVPSIILTTFDDHQLVLEGLQAGARGFLLKDVSLESLVNAIEMVHQGETLVQPAITERILKGLSSLVSAQDEPERVEALSVKEIEVLRLMAGGYSNREIAGAIHKSEGTVKNQVSSILDKLVVRDRTPGGAPCYKSGSTLNLRPQNRKEGVVMASHQTMFPRCVLLVAAVVLSGVTAPQTAAQTEGDWPMYRGNHAGTGYSALNQISADNVSDLVESWRYSLSSDGGRGQPNSQATAIVIGGVMYLPAADRVVALNPLSGEEIWRYTVEDGAPSRRGVAYWAGAEGIAPRIIFTAGRRLLALDAETGLPATDFGQSGEIDMVIPYNSVPMVYENIVIVGANTPRGASGGIGNARAFDARSGDKIWEFSSVPQPGSLGHDSWAGDSWMGRLGANAWPFYFTVDAQRGLLYLPLASPIPFAYGGDRGGANLFANSLVAVDIRSGEYKWHFQTIHHDLWDHDPPAPPALFDIVSGGSTVPALGVTTKSGYLYILNRVTGEPIFGVEERAMPASDVPGEQTFPTQPIPLRPPPLARVSYDPADLVSAADTSLEHAAACAELLASIGEIYNAGAFTPWAYRPDGSTGKTTLLFPGLTGGPNWGGAAFDPNSGYIFVFSQDLGTFGWMEDAEDGSEFPFVRRGPRLANFDVRIGELRLPCQKPPWGKLTAVDSVTGDVVWQQVVGVSENLPPGRQHTGRPGRAAALVTAGEVLFIAATDDNRLRALATATGEELWVVKLPGRGNANPMTYMGADSKQYVLVSATDSVVAYHLR